MSILCGCSASDERAPFINDDCDPAVRDCAAESGAGLPGLSGGNGLSGSVTILAGSVLASTNSLGDAKVRVSAPGESGGTVSAETNDSGRFSLEDARRDPNTWMKVTKITGAIWGTHERVDSSDGSVSLHAVNQEDLTDVLAGLDPAMMLSGSEAHALFDFGRSGVKVTGPGRVAYRVTGGFSTSATQTQGSGVVLLAGISTNPSLRQISYSEDGGASKTLSFPVSAGHVSIAEIEDDD